MSQVRFRRLQESSQIWRVPVTVELILKGFEDLWGVEESHTVNGKMMRSRWSPASVLLCKSEFQLAVIDWTYAME